MVVVVIIIIIMSIVQLMESPGKPQGPTPTRCLVESHSSRMADPLCTVQKLCFHCNHVSLLANTQIHTKIYNIILLFGYIYIYVYRVSEETNRNFSLDMYLCDSVCVWATKVIWGYCRRRGQPYLISFSIPWPRFPKPHLVVFSTSLFVLLGGSGGHTSFRIQSFFFDGKSYVFFLPRMRTHTSSNVHTQRVTSRLIPTQQQAHSSKETHEGQ